MYYNRYLLLTFSWWTINWLISKLKYFFLHIEQTKVERWSCFLSKPEVKCSADMGPFTFLMKTRNIQYEQKWLLKISFRSMSQKKTFFFAEISYEGSGYSLLSQTITYSFLYSIAGKPVFTIFLFSSDARYLTAWKPKIQFFFFWNKHLYNHTTAKCGT